MFELFLGAFASGVALGCFATRNGRKTDYRFALVTGIYLLAVGAFKVLH